AKQEVYTCVQQKEWATRLKTQPVKKGDFIYIPSGTVHALGPGVVLLEIQQTSDRTYRLYDFDRVDDTGNLRELHIEKAVEVMNIPDRRTEELIRTDLDSGLTTELISKPSFTIMRHQVDGTPAILERAETFRLISVASGEGFVQDEDGTQAIRAGEHYFIPKGKGPHLFTGKVEIVTSEVPVPTTQRINTVYQVEKAQDKHRQVSSRLNTEPR
ncbi:MAG: class I mannose-6-phosphate isomerase, partial [Exiguobacterium sp.]